MSKLQYGPQKRKYQKLENYSIKSSIHIFYKFHLVCSEIISPKYVGHTVSNYLLALRIQKQSEFCISDKPVKLNKLMSHYFDSKPSE